MKHVSEIIQEPWFYKKPWLLLGTGPSLDSFDPTEHEDKNIACIYAAVEAVLSPEILFAPDIGYFKHLNMDYKIPGMVSVRVKREIFNSQSKVNIISRAFNNYKGAPKAYYFEYDCDIKGYPNPNHEIPYDGVYHGGDGKRYFPEHKPWPCSCTAKAAILFFGMAGVKQLYTCGIDGGTDMSLKTTSLYRNQYIEGQPGFCNLPTFDSEVSDLHETASKLGIELIKI